MTTEHDEGEVRKHFGIPLYANMTVPELREKCAAYAVAFTSGMTKPDLYQALIARLRELRSSELEVEEVDEGDTPTSASRAADDERPPLVVVGPPIANPLATARAVHPSSSDGRPTIGEAMNAVMLAVPVIPKEQRMGGDSHGYAFRGIDQFYSTLQPLIAAQGIVVIPKVLDIQRDTFTTRNQSQLMMTVVTVRYRFIGPRGDHLDVVMVGEGSDTLDKSASKAMSTAMKYALMQVFLVPTQGGEDADQAHIDEQLGTPAAPPPPPPEGFDDWDTANEMNRQARAALQQAAADETLNAQAVAWKEAHSDLDWKEPWPLLACQTAIEIMLAADGTEPFI